MKSLRRAMALSLVLCAVPLAGCGEKSWPRRAGRVAQDSEARQAERIAAAKATAREGVITDVYAEWERAFAVHRLELETHAADSKSARSASSSSPVRSLDELMREVDPEGRDPVMREKAERWKQTCANYQRRLVELGNDPSTDPRSPLVQGADQ